MPTFTAPTVNVCHPTVLARLSLLAAAALLGACASLPAPSAHPQAPQTAAATPVPQQAPAPASTAVLAQGDAAPVLAQPITLTPLPDVTTLAPVPVVADGWWARMRQGFQLAPLEHPLVHSHTQRFETSDYLNQRAERLRLFMPLIVQAIEARGLPMELAMVPLVESALNCHAQSVVKATGCWQFMPATALDQKLMVSAVVDQRRDLLQSTAAALDYLQQLHTQTQDWHLAMAAYNWGIGRVLRLVQQARAAGQPTDFASLAARMPEETRNYVPQIEALKRLVLHAPQRLPQLPEQASMQTVTLHQDLDLLLAARWAGLPVANLRALNHAIAPPVILAAAVPQLLLPTEAAERFEQARAAHRGSQTSWQLVRIQGQTDLTRLARQHGIGVAELRAVNRVGTGLRPAPGSTLWLPLSHQPASEPFKASADLVASARQQWVPETVRLLIKALPRETLAQAAGRLQLPLASLRTWNPGLPAKKALKPGRELAVVVPYHEREALLLRAQTRAAPSQLAQATPAGRADKPTLKPRTLASQQAKPTRTQRPPAPPRTAAQRSKGGKTVTAQLAASAVVRR